MSSAVERDCSFVENNNPRIWLNRRRHHRRRTNIMPASPPKVQHTSHISSSRPFHQSRVRDYLFNTVFVYDDVSSPFNLFSEPCYIYIYIHTYPNLFGVPIAVPSRNRQTCTLFANKRIFTGIVTNAKNVRFSITFRTFVRFPGKKVLFEY